MISTRIPLKGRVLVADLLMTGGFREKLRRTFLWDTGASRTTMSWQDALDLGYTEKSIMENPKEKVGSTAVGEDVYGYALALPMVLMYVFNTNNQFAEIVKPKVWVSKERDLNRLLGLDITSLFNYNWDNSVGVVGVVIRDDVSSEIQKRTASNLDGTTSGMGIRSLTAIDSATEKTGVFERVPGCTNQCPYYADVEICCSIGLCFGEEGCFLTR